MFRLNPVILEPLVSIAASLVCVVIAGIINLFCTSGNNGG